MAELPAAEIADSGAPMPASFSEPPPEPRHVEPERAPERPPSSANVPATPAIRQAIEEILRINKDLEWVLLEMEKAVETLEEAEVQKYADEREVESLRNAVRQLSRTRESVQRVQQGGGPRRPDPRRSRNPQREHREPRDQRDQREPREQRYQSHHHAERHPEHSDAHSSSASHEQHEEEHRHEPPSEPEIPV